MKKHPVETNETKLAIYCLIASAILSFWPTVARALGLSTTLGLQNDPYMFGVTISIALGAGLFGYYVGLTLNKSTKIKLLTTAYSTIIFFIVAYSTYIFSAFAY